MRKFVVIVAITLGGAQSASAQAVDPICDGIRDFLSSALGVLPFRSLPYEYSMVKAPSGLKSTIGKCTVERDRWAQRMAVSCISREAPKDRVGKEMEEERFAPVRTERDALAVRLATCPAFAGWTRTEPKVSLGYAESAEDVTWEDPANGRRVIARAERTRTGSRGRFNVGYETRLVVMAPLEAE